MENVACEHCCFFSQPDPEKPQGECRRSAPSRNWRVAEWPLVKRDDFCGEFLKAAE